jgi:hydrogenase maturation protease
VLVIGVGQPGAGDDGVGVAVLDALYDAGVPKGVALVRAADPTALVDLLAVDVPVVLVDAVAGGTPGDVMDLAPTDLAARATAACSTHGLDVAGAIALADALHPDERRTVRIVGIGIERPVRQGFALSSAVAAAVPRAVARVRALVGD